MTAHDRRVIRRAVLVINLARARDWWDTLSWWHQIMLAGVLWTAFWLACLHAAYPWLLKAVTA